MTETPDFGSGEVVHDFTYNAVNTKPTQVVADLGDGSLLVLTRGSIAQIEAGGDTSVTHGSRTVWASTPGTASPFSGGYGYHGLFTPDGSVLLGHDYTKVMEVTPASSSLWATDPWGTPWSFAADAAGNVWSSLYDERFREYAGAGVLVESYNERGWDEAGTVPYDISQFRWVDGLLYAGAFSGIWVGDPADLYTDPTYGEILPFSCLHKFSTSFGDGAEVAGMEIVGDRIYFIGDWYGASGKMHLMSIPLGGDTTASLEWISPDTGYTVRGIDRHGDYLYVAATDAYKVWRFPIAPATRRPVVGYIGFG